MSNVNDFYVIQARAVELAYILIDDGVDPEVEDRLRTWNTDTEDLRSYMADHAENWPGEPEVAHDATIIGTP